MDSFSQRHGYEPPEADITVREDAPYQLRGVVVDLAYDSGLKPGSLRPLVCRVLRVREDENNWSDYPNINNEIRGRLDACHWYEVYEVVEAVAQELRRAEQEPWSDRTQAYRPQHFELELNRYFRREGIGWQLKDGLVNVRGPEAFEQSLAAAKAELEESNRATAANEIHEALRDLSRRPSPDITGAIQHALAAVECVMRDVFSDPKPTIGDLVKRHREKIPPPLDTAIEKLWGYASEQGRHLREGRVPSQREAELVVQVAAAISAYLSKMPE